MSPSSSQSQNKQTQITESPATFLPALKGINSVRKYLIKFVANDNIMATINSADNEVQSSAETKEASPYFS
jgi:hypothetical protein